MNWEFIGKYLPMYEKAALLTVKIGVIGILFAILLGLVCAAIQYYKVPVLRWIVAVYVEHRFWYSCFLFITDFRRLGSGCQQRSAVW